MKLLRIQIYLPILDTDVFNFDFSLLSSLEKLSPKFEEGRKVSSDYLGTKAELVVRKTFTDIKENGVLTKLSMKVDWYNQDGIVGLTKTQIIKKFNVSERGTILRKRRSRVIDYLQASAIGTPIENYVNAILKKYKTEIELYILNGTDDFVNAINNETDQTYIAYLNIVIDTTTGVTVKDSILNQIISQ